MNPYLRTLIFLFILLSNTSCEVNTLSSSSEPRFKTGDSLHWAAKDYEDNAWNDVREDTKESLFWARFTVELGEPPPAGKHLGLKVQAFGAYEAYWDGVLIGENGTVGRSSASEKPGTENSYFLIPDSLTNKGKHVVALRASQAHLSALQRGMRVNVAHYFQMVRAPLIHTAFMYILAGAFLVAAVYHFFLFINDHKEHPTLIFSITCFLFFALLILEYVKFYVDLPYTHYYTRLELIGGLTFAIALLVPLYFTLQFSFPHRKLI